MDSIQSLRDLFDQAGEPSRTCPVEHHDFFGHIFRGLQQSGKASPGALTMEQVFEIQAYADGELSGSDRRKVEKLLAGNAAARTLLAQLKNTAALTPGSDEVLRSCPESHDFYWAGIHRELQAGGRDSSSPATQTAAGPLKSMLQWLLNPVVVPAALVFIICIMVGHQFERRGIYQQVQVSSAYVDQQSGIAVYFVDSPEFLNGAID
jgi:anti-sigma factor RsiW